MHYYKHYIGDYRRDTSHLTLLEHGIYRQLIDSYCLDEAPLTNDLAKLMRSHSVRTAEEQQALQNVLTDFFELTESGYIHKRCEKTVAEYHGKSDKARQSANARWHKENNKLQSNDANAMQTHTEGNANHKPLTINQEPKVSKRTSAPSCPPDVDEVVWNDWKQLRKSKRATVSETVVEQARKEAAKAQMSLSQFLKEWCLRGSQGLKAEWLTNNQNDKRTEHQKRQDATARALLGDAYYATPTMTAIEGEVINEEPPFTRRLGR